MIQINLPFWRRKDYLENQIGAAIVWLDIHADENRGKTHSCSKCREVEEMLRNFHHDLNLANAVVGLETHLTATPKHDAKHCEMCIHHIKKIERFNK